MVGLEQWEWNNVSTLPNYDGSKGMNLHTSIGPFTISTIGNRQGCYRTSVHRQSSWNELESKATIFENPELAPLDLLEKRGRDVHLEMCLKYAKIAGEM